MAIDTSTKLAKQVILDTTWYHATENENWASDILLPAPHYSSEYGPYIGHVDSTLMVHVGSRDAALDRAKALMEENPNAGPFWLFEVSISPKTPMARKLFADESHWPETAAGCSKDGHYSDFVVGINQYENTHEDAGSISLLVDAHAVQVLAADRIDVLVA